ncbi:hypothetical protein DERP_009410 [Dermatophagoides pteronyssinus]|uniref:Uncharacterized protein n=1 Tax=Dermatophagoides pteronyssinus TaxID=6956 RepID=A0ABQ8ITR6_DERPT|nr:hypothetical protein DERP_009410 [Dermatophagoides pteronyssinus]
MECVILWQLVRLLNKNHPILNKRQHHLHVFFISKSLLCKKTKQNKIYLIPGVNLGGCVPNSSIASSRQTVESTSKQTASDERNICLNVFSSNNILTPLLPLKEKKKPHICDDDDVLPPQQPPPKNSDFDIAFQKSQDHQIYRLIFVRSFVDHILTSTSKRLVIRYLAINGLRAYNLSAGIIVIDDLVDKI